MSDLGTEVLKRYGVTAIVSALVAGCAIWALAHFVAAPGSEVSVLWGLVKYTKKTSPTEGSNSDINLSPAAAPQSLKSTRPAIDLFLHGDVHPANLEKTLTSIRLGKNLRELTTAESGRQTREIPSGTYFYLLGRWLHTLPSVASSSFQEQIATLEVSRYRASDSYVEIQYPGGDKLQLILFVDELTAQKVAKLSGATSHEVTAALTPWGNATTLVSVPVDRVLRSRVREVQPQKADVRLVLDMLLQ